MAILLNDSIKVQGGKPVEDKRLNNGTPWESVEQVNQNILPTDRYISLEVLIGDRIYWYKGGVADSDLVEKEMPNTILETVLLKITSNVNTEDLIDNMYQKGKTIVTQGTANIVVTINSDDGFVASYQKAGTGDITFQAGSGKNLIQVDNVHVIDGMKGSTATITVIGNEVLLRVSNA